MQLQYQLSNGSWVDCGERTEEFLGRLERNNGPRPEGETRCPSLLLLPRGWARRDATRAEVIDALERGAELRNHAEDWYSVCRLRPAPVSRPRADLVKCDCGHKCERVLAMSASLGTSCPDCYDRMS